MSLNRLHNIGQETFAFLDETIFPHLVGDQTNEIGREQDFLDRGRIRETGCWNLQTTDEAIEDVLLQTFRVLHELDLLFRRVLVVSYIGQTVGTHA